MEGKSMLRAAIVVSCLAITFLGYQNASGDNSDVIPIASRAACPTPTTCSASLSQTARSSFSQDYSFQVQDGVGPKAPTRTVVVECKRALIFVGDWSCAPKTN
ncbi:MAG TPA: hypothetical protein VHB79_13455 [Polyangiaceae bacterium]|nr:hypothetical protein [Polyangiaceae bacterium]